MIHVGPIHTRASPGKQRGLPKRVGARNTKRRRQRHHLLHPSPVHNNNPNRQIQGLNIP
jgi:hypothetical protein